ncbi:hypothetical protein Nepgr_008799 [Nepenthes gracilis]|uniref:Neprosin PEP catalytic domain-containing protein n=1 Tax=Nepenthes gracilis TaxID=150966 RepID=A0AAD3XJM2_NEPGR|nr:hypothetical protein Nepgr_008799 [Nepenthes gracilis]
MLGMAFFGWMLKFNMLLLATNLIVFCNGTQDRHMRASFGINKMLKVLNKPAVKSIQSSDGDIIDCVDIYKQPAFDHPALKNHTIQMRPSFIPAAETFNNKNYSKNIVMPLQIWQKSGSCPKGTIPIRKIRKQDLLRAASLESFGRKNPEISSGSDKMQGHNFHTLDINGTNVTLGHQVNRSTAMLVATAFHFTGARGSFNIWHPNVVSSDEFTTSQIWLRSGPPEEFESVESGWTVNPKIYGDKQTRIFIYWTTGCFDLLCSGFVQTSKEISLGAAIPAISSRFGPQYEIAISIYSDKKTGNWWLLLKDNITVGYWPGELFSQIMRYSAHLAEWGGQVYSPNGARKTPHTATQMGSGEFAESLFGAASYVAHIRIMDWSYYWKYPEYVGTFADEWNCYTAFNYVQGYMFEPVLYFGGPGQNPRCP